ncbi:hypothetical protein [Draconibacterium sediminis]|uniref:hypothetical protein n=1 Tax=Draconibacterium sediminis TaxID=1544798 RepID=UPI0026EBF03A|nr:hypothetical protein [Draconibacterium sediminis]
MLIANISKLNSVQMKNVSLLIVVTILSITSFAQDLKTVAVPRGAQRQSREVVDGITTHNYSQKNKIPVNGTPYLNEEFLPGILELKDGAKSDEVLMRYNIASDAFEVIQDSDTLILNQPYKLNQIWYDNKVFIFDPLMRTDAERKYNGFFQLLLEGKLSLYEKQRKDLKFDSFTPNYQGGSGTKEYYYVDKTSYVARFQDGSGFLMNSKGSFLKYIDSKYKSQVKSFIKQNRIKFNNQSDLIKLVKYVNSLY